MSVKPKARIFTIPPGQPFADCLVNAVLAGNFPHAETPAPAPEILPRYTLLVPTRRAQRALMQAFLNTSGKNALLLPDIRPIGDVDEDEFFLEDGPFTTPLGRDDHPDIPPAISRLDRQLILMRLIMKWSEIRARVHEDLESDVIYNITPAQAASLAADLGKLIDAADTEGIDLGNLKSLVPEDYERYWQITLEFLQIITEALPQILAEKNQIQPHARRNILIRAQTQRLQVNPPDAPVIAAGSTGSIPATAALLSAIAHLPNGAVVLPGLDIDLDDEAWREIGPEHPQYGMKQLLEAMEVDRTDVLTLPGVTHEKKSLSVSRLVSEALRPWKTTDQWQSRLAAIDVNSARQALSGIEIITAPTQREEAAAIALVMRQAIDNPVQTIALVTPDRTLARRVAAQLRRWEIVVDDSAGLPLTNTQTAVFVSLVIEAAAEGFSAVPLLAMLKHPLCRLGLDPADIRARIRNLEQAVLRGPKLKSGIKTLKQSLVAQRRRAEDGERVPANVASLTGEDWDKCNDLLNRLEHAVDPLENLSASPVSLGDIARAHILTSELLSAQTDPPGETALWSGDAGEMLGDLFETLLNAEDTGLHLTLRSYQPMLGVLMLGAVVRPPASRHPRAHIWGPLEARLQQPDVLILGSLNETTWPALPDAGPWLSRPMHSALGLQPPERRIGLSAHDFAQAVAAPRVILTRAEKSGGSPTVPSRWVLRLEAIAAGLGLVDCFKSSQPWLDWVQGLDYDNTPARPVPAPRPCPPVAARPRKLSVTDIETWIRDPYAIFARKILKLEELDPLEASPDASHRGLIIHDALQKFIEQNIAPDADDALEKLLAIGRRSFEKTNIWPSVHTLWWPRFERVAEWFIATEIERSCGVHRHVTEVSGSYVFDADGEIFTLTARADRIDLRESGNTAVIYDYKTGTTPSAVQVFSGLSPQLPLEAAILKAGGFDNIPAMDVLGIVYIRLSGGEPAGETKSIDKYRSETISPARAGDEAIEGLNRRVVEFNRQSTPYLSRLIPKFERSIGTYDHLARLKEWQRFGVDEGE